MGHVRNTANVAVMLASTCELNDTMRPGEERFVNFTRASVWLVPSGMSWDCNLGCGSCARISINASVTSDVAAHLGYGFAAEDLGWENVDDDGQYDVTNLWSDQHTEVKTDITVYAGANSSTVLNVSLSQWPNA